MIFLKEQKQSDKFFDNAVNVLLGVSENKNKKIKDDNLLNFYLSSVTFQILNMNQLTKQIEVFGSI